MKAPKIIVFINFILRGTGTTLCQPRSGHDSSLCLWSNIDRLEPVSTCTHLVILASVKTKLSQMIASLIDL